MKKLVVALLVTVSVGLNSITFAQNIIDDCTPPFEPLEAYLDNDLLKEWLAVLGKDRRYQSIRSENLRAKGDMDETTFAQNEVLIALFAISDNPTRLELMSDMTRCLAEREIITRDEKSAYDNYFRHVLNSDLKAAIAVLRSESDFSMGLYPIFEAAQNASASDSGNATSQAWSDVTSAGAALVWAAAGAALGGPPGAAAGATMGAAVGKAVGEVQSGVAGAIGDAILGEGGEGEGDGGDGE